MHAARAAVVGLQPTLIASRALHLLLEQSVMIQKFMDVRRPCQTQSGPLPRSARRSSEAAAPQGQMKIYLNLKMGRNARQRRPSSGAASHANSEGPWSDPE